MSCLEARHSRLYRSRRVLFSITRARCRRSLDVAVNRQRVRLAQGTVKRRGCGRWGDKRNFLRICSIV